MASGGVSPAPSVVEAGGVIVTTNGDVHTKDGDIILTNGTASGSRGSSIYNEAASGALTTTDDKVKICVFMGASPGKSPAHMEAARELARTMAAHDICMYISINLKDLFYCLCMAFLLPPELIVYLRIYHFPLHAQEYDSQQSFFCKLLTYLLALVYGGGTVGLMGEVARTLVSLKGPTSVHGIIPLPLVKYERSSESENADLNNGIEGVPKYDSYGRTTVVKDMHTRKQMMASEVLSGAKGSGFIALSGGYGTMEELMEVITWNQLGIHNRGVVALNVDGFWDGILNWVQGSVAAGFISEGNGDIMKGVNTPEEAIKALQEYKPSKGRFKLEWGNVSQG